MNVNYFTTKEFSMPTNSYIKSVLFMIISRWWWIPTLLLFVCFMMSAMINATFIYVALILVFIISPTLLMFVYFHQLTTFEARIAILKKHIIINNEGLKINFSPIKRVVYSEGEEYEEEFTPESYFVHKNQIRKIINMGSYAKFYLEGGHYKFISIPFKEINESEEEFLAYILQYVKHENENYD